MTNDSSLPEIPAKERLELNRQALIDQFSSRRKPARGSVPTRVQMVEGRRIAVPAAPAASHSAAAAVESAEDAFDSTDGTGTGDGLSTFWPIAKHMAGTWWEYHPARAVLSMGRPFLEDYVERRPWKAVAVAAGIGATLVVVRPWKLLSVGGVVVAAMKSSQVSSIALSLISAAQSSAELARNNLRNPADRTIHPSDDVADRFEAHRRP